MALTKNTAQCGTKKLTERQTALVTLLENRPSGLIRHEVANLMNIPLASVCSLANTLINRGEILENGTRLSPYGHSASILTLPAGREESTNG